MYRISHISTSSSDGGSAVSARRIHNQLLAKRINSQLFVSDNDNSEEKIFFFTTINFLRVLDKFFNYFLNKLGLQYFFVPSNFFLNKDLSKSSIIQLYNTHGGYFQITTLKKLNSYAPLVWRLSDYWAMTGHCAYPGECEKWKTLCKNCPSLNSYPEIGIDNTANIWNKKKKIIEKLNLKIVVPSDRMYKHVKKSPILKNKDTYIIPNGIDTKIFKPLNKKFAKKKLKISEKFSVLFISQVAFDNYRKGTDFLKKVLDTFREDKNIQFLVAGMGSEKWNDFSFKNLITFDYNKSIEWKRLLYNSSDLTIVPSINENFPNVILESMSCGTPVISFNTGGISNIIDNKNGVLVERFDIDKFIKSISSLSQNKEILETLKKNSRKTIVRKFSVSNEVKNYIKIYKKIINENKQKYIK